MSASERVSVARAALLEITPAEDVGDFVSETIEDDGVATLLFVATMAGYPGWHWTVSVVELEGEAPTVLEAELLPGEGALLAPDWIPWSDRLEDLRLAQAAAAAEAGLDAEPEADTLDDDLDEDLDEDELVDEADEDGDDLVDDDEDDDVGDEDEDEDDEDEDDDDEDDDLGDDPDDGIDFESDEALAGMPAPVGVDEQDEPDAESDEDGPEPPAAPIRKQRAKKQQ